MFNIALYSWFISGQNKTDKSFSSSAMAMHLKITSPTTPKAPGFPLATFVTLISIQWGLYPPGRNKTEQIPCTPIFRAKWTKRIFWLNHGQVVPPRQEMPEPQKFRINHSWTLSYIKFTNSEIVHELAPYRNVAEYKERKNDWMKVHLSYLP